MLKQYYNKETQRLTFPYDFNEELSNLPWDIKVIIFEEEHSKEQYSKFNQPVSYLPNSITHLTFGCYFNQPVDNLPKSIKKLGFSSNSKIKNNIPENIEDIEIIFFGFHYDSIVENIPCHIKKIKINRRDKINYLKKIPFGCKVVDEEEKEIFLE